RVVRAPRPQGHQTADVELGHAWVSKHAAAGVPQIRGRLRFQKVCDNYASLIKASKVPKGCGSVAARDIVGRHLRQDAARDRHALFEVAGEKMSGCEPEQGEV